jgi:hypothetical protein
VNNLDILNIFVWVHHPLTESMIPEFVLYVERQAFFSSIFIYRHV